MDSSVAETVEVASNGKVLLITMDLAKDLVSVLWGGCCQFEYSSMHRNLELTFLFYF